MPSLTEPRVWVFFYGSYINFDVLKEGGLMPGEWEVARLPGFDLRIAPRANLIRSERDTVWGINATATHAELEHLYTVHSKGVLGETYLPEAVVTSTVDGKLRPVMTYISPHMVARPAEAAYVDRIATPARKYGFPQWYVDRIEAFKP